MNLTSELLDQALPQAAAATGMVRIARGNKQRWIWPVHLPGWIALGWQVSHPDTAAPAAAAPGEAELDTEAPTEPQPEAISLTDVPAATNVRRRGRKPKAQEPAAHEITAEPVETIPAVEPEAPQGSVDGAVDGVAEAAPATAMAEASTPAATAVEAAEDAAAPAFVLPDDLLSETF